jgi:hypothetical protein
MTSELTRLGGPGAPDPWRPCQARRSYCGVSALEREANFAPRKRSSPVFFEPSRNGFRRTAVSILRLANDDE